MSLNIRIKKLRADRAAILAKSVGLSDKASKEDRLFTDDEQKEFDGYLAEVGTLDKNLEALLAQERLLAISADPVQQPGNDPNLIPNTPDPRYAPGTERGFGGVRLLDPTVKFNPFPGQAFTRYVMAIANSRGSMATAMQIARRWENETPEVFKVLEAHNLTGMKMTEAMVQRAAVAAGTTQNPTWAAPLIWATNMTSEFIELLRPLTFLGRLNLRTIPFNVRIPRQTSGALVSWVGEGQSKMVTKMDFDAITVPWAKMATIVVITQELARFSNPAAEMLVRDDLLAAIAQFKDQQFIDPTVAPVANLKPGAITYGLPAQNVIPSSGVTFAAIITDITKLVIAMSNQNLPMQNMVWLMSPAAKMIIQSVRTTMDMWAFPEMRVGDGTLWGWPIITSNNIPTSTATPGPAGLSPIVLMDQSLVYYATDNGIDIETSTEASLQMDSAPTTPPTPLVSLWQQNMLGIKAEEYNYWLRRRDAAVGMITGFNTVPGP